MKHLGRNILVAIGGAVLLAQAQSALGSTYLSRFLDANLVSLLIALLAINAASLGIILSKIRDLADGGAAADAFSKTRGEMLLSVREQVVLIFVSLILLTLKDSAWQAKHPQSAEAIATAVIACFTYGMLLLYDTARGVFVILSFRVPR